MAHILVGWELGGNQGHARRMITIARALREDGHRISFAPQRIDAIAPEDAAGAEIWPAPVSPRLLISTGRHENDATHSMGDILPRLGFDDPELIAAMLRGWFRLLDAIRPDLVIGDFAPFLLTAARGRVPSISAGTGFTVPPSAMKTFPSLTGRAPADEEKTLDIVNRGLRRAGCETLDALPRLFGASREIAETFKELDRYAIWRTDELALPAPPIPENDGAGGQELFVYVPEALQSDAALWQGLSLAQLPVRVHVPRAGPDHRQKLVAMGFAFEEAPLPFARIAERSRLVLSHGGHGFVCSALMAGLPQVVCHVGLERALLGDAVARMGLGGQVPMLRIEPEGFAASLNALYRDDQLAAHARAAGRVFRSRDGQAIGPAVANAAAQLLR